jgi:hypothetical protein
MRVLAIVHQRDAGPGVFAEAIRARGAQPDSWLRSETDAPSPSRRANVIGKAR